MLPQFEVVLKFTIKNPVSEYVYTYGIMVQLYLIERFPAKLQELRMPTNTEWTDFIKNMSSTYK